MATSYTATFGGACSPAAPCIFDSNATQKTGALSTGIGLPPPGVTTDGVSVGSPTYIGGAAQQILAETSGNPNLP